MLADQSNERRKVPSFKQVPCVRNNRRRHRLLLLIAAVLFLPAAQQWTELLPLTGGFQVCMADEVEKPEQQPESESDLTRLGDDSQQILTDRRILLQSQRLQQLISHERYAEALDELRLLSHAHPSLMVPRQTDLWEPVYRMLFRSVFLLPTNILNHFRQENASYAEAEFQQALKAGSPNLLVSLIQRFPGSDASCQAHLVLAQRNLNRGHRLAAIFWLEPLTAPGVPDPWKTRSTAILELLTEQLEKSRMAASGQAATKGPDSQIKSQSQSASETGESVIPMHLHWRQTSALPPVAAEAIDRLISSAHQLAIIPWTNWRPLIDDRRVYIRTMRGVAAIGRDQGETDWLWSAARSLDSQLILQGRNYEDAPAPPGAAAENTFSSLDRSTITNLLHRNGVVGRLTSDEKRLYLIQDDWQSSSATVPAPFFLRTQSRQPDVPPAQLIALEKSTGRRLWTAGGEPIEEKYGNELTQAWIAGPPTVNGRSLYCVIEQRDAIYLVCLTAETGKMNWKVLLTYPGVGIARDPVRRIQAAMPTAGGGLIWTTTTSGWMVAVDVLTRSQVWAYRTGKSDSTEEMRVVRGRMFATTPQSSLRSGRQDHGPSLSGTRLVVFPGDSNDLLILNSLTGELENRISVPGRSLVLHVDEERIVVGGPRTITAYHPPDGSRIWETSLPQKTHQPTGPGVARGSHLLVSMADGSISAFAFSNGKLIESRANLRAAPVWGGLFAAGDDVVAYSPSESALLSAEPPNAGNISLLDQAELLAEQGNVEAALDLLQQVPSTSPQTERIRQLRFQYLARSVQQNDGSSITALEQMQQIADTTSEKAEVIRLKLNAAVQNGDFNTAVRQIFEALQQEPGILRQSITLGQDTPAESDQQLESQRTLTSTSFGTIQQPLQNWLLVTLANLLDQLEPTLRQETLARILSETDLILLELPHPAVQPMLLHRAQQRMQQGELSEHTLHLLLQSLALAERFEGAESQSVADRDSVLRQLKIFQQQLADAQTADTNWKAIRLQLLETLFEEFISRQPSGRSADGIAETTRLPDFRKQLRQAWEAWPEGPFTAIPVTQSSAMPQLEQPMALRDQQDAFLGRYEWQILRTSPFLKARSLTGDQSAVWSVSGNFPNSGPYSQTTDSITRCGSVTAVQTGQTISAFSILDQRVMWSRQMSGSLVPDFLTGRISDTHFKDYNVRNRTRLGAMFTSDFQVCGSTDRWTCLKSPTQLEIIDNLTGRARWSLTGSLGRVEALTAKNLVLLVSSEVQKHLVVSIVDGTMAESRITPEQLQRTLVAAENELALFRSSTGKQRNAAIDWIDPVTAQTNRSVSLAGAHAFQFLDTRTLIAMSDDSFRVIDLFSGEIQRCAFPTSNSGKGDKTTDADEPQNAAEGATGFQRQWTICADPINYYMFVRPQLQSPLPTRFVGRNLTPIDGTLSAFDRQTGVLSWTLDAGSSLSATFDQPMTPVLLLIDADAAMKAVVGAGGQPGTSGVFFRGILKSTGQQLFQHRLSSRFPIPFVRLMTNRNYQVDVEAYRSRIRFQPAESALDSTEAKP